MLIYVLRKLVLTLITLLLLSLLGLLACESSTAGAPSPSRTPTANTACASTCASRASTC